MTGDGDGERSLCKMVYKEGRGIIFIDIITRVKFACVCVCVSFYHGNLDFSLFTQLNISLSSLSSLCPQFSHFASPSFLRLCLDLPPRPPFTLIHSQLTTLSCTLSIFASL